MNRLALRRMRQEFEAAYLRRPISALVRLRRRMLTRPIFVGITGTAGKSTTKELTAAVLDCLGPGVKSPESRRGGSAVHYNRYRHLVHSMLKTTQKHRYCVQELGALGPGTLKELVECFCPDIGVVLNVGLEHRSAFGTEDAVAVEKGRLVEALPTSGTAILNADDPRVLAMRERTSARVVTFGMAAQADVRAENVHSAWPEPLRLDVVHNGQRQSIQTQLHGEHWAYAVLAAFAVGRCVGVSADDAAAAIAGVAPVAGRFDPITTPQGITFLCDDYKFPYWNAQTFLRVVEQAEAQRKLIVFGTMSDFSGNSRAKFRRIARQALDAADLVVFLGERSGRYLRTMCDETDRLVICEDVCTARDYLRRTMLPGDLIFLKGTDKDGDLRSVAETVVAERRSRCETSSS